MFPDAPTFKELGIPFGLNSWDGLVAPKGMPAPVLKRLEDALQKAVNQRDVRPSLGTCACNDSHRLQKHWAIGLRPTMASGGRDCRGGCAAPSTDYCRRSTELRRSILVSSQATGWTVSEAMSAASRSSNLSGGKQV